MQQEWQVQRPRGSRESQWDIKMRAQDSVRCIWGAWPPQGLGPHQEFSFLSWEKMRSLKRAGASVLCAWRELSGCAGEGTPWGQWIGRTPSRHLSGFSFTCVGESIPAGVWELVLSARKATMTKMQECRVLLRMLKRQQTGWEVAQWFPDPTAAPQAEQSSRDSLEALWILASPTPVPHACLLSAGPGRH